MKKIFLIIVLISGCIIAQSWNNIITTTINEPNLVQLDNFTNRDGIHVVAQNSNSTNSIKYYRLNSSGGVQTSTTIETSGGAEFPHIAGDNDHMYISYRLGNNIVTKKYIYSTGTWESQTPISLNNQDCNSVDNAYNDAGLHIVFSEYDGSSSYKTHYWLYASFYPSNHFVVNDYADYLGWPTISLSSNKAHVGFHSYGYAKTRDKNLTNNSWESTQGVAIADGNERVQSGCDKLFDFYDVLVPGIFVNLYVKERGINSSTWSSPQLLNYSVHPYLEGRVTSTVTSDGKTHIIYDSEQIIHRSYNCATSSWSDEYEVTSSPGLTQSSSISAVSNDLYIVFREYGGSNIKYRQYDSAPLAPQNPQLSANPGNNKVRVSWSKNNEPDIAVYEVWRKVAELGGNWTNLGTTTNNYFVDNEYLYAPGAGDFTLTYKIRAKDIGNHLFRI
ncbi:hypothetical protein [Ignavibacterium sp.]|uniref:hypothetical protein n=1 Tax=Ignavibacterium sp. TaxID=2651167 RepID=UPI00307F0833